MEARPRAVTGGVRLDAARSASWALVESVGSQALSFFVFLILARVLAPADYGLMALVSIMIGVPAVIITNGLLPVLVKRHPMTEADCSTVFWVNLAIGIVLAALTAAGSGGIAALVGNPRLGPILAWMSLTFVIAAMGTVPSAFYQQDFKYKRFALRSMLGILAGGLVGIGLALDGWGVWALVANQLVQNVVSLAVLWTGTRWVPRIALSRQSFDEMLGEGLNSILGNFLFFLVGRIDLLIIGLFDRTAVILGYYYFVTRLLFLVGTVTWIPINAVLVPVLSRMQGDHQRLRSTFLSLLWTTQALWTPLVAGLGAIAPILVPRLFGAHWESAVPLLQIAALTAFSASLSFHSYSVLLATHHLTLYVWLTVAQIALTVIAFVIAAPHGLIWIGVAYASLSFAVAALHLLCVGHALKVSPWDVLVRLATVSIAGVVMLAAVAWIGQAAAGFGSVTELAAQVILGGTVYVGVMFALARSDMRELVGTLMDMSKRRTASVARL